MAVFEGSSQDQLTLILFWALICYFPALAFYRLFLDPLSIIPGPRLAALTRYYEAYFDVVQNGQYTWKIDELHKQYGPIVRISPYEVHIKDPAFFGQLYRQDGKWEKYEWMQRAFAAGPKSTFNTIQHDVHRKRRAPLDLFFSKANVARRQNIIRAAVHRLCDRIDSAAASASTFDLGDALAATSTDIATQYILGKSFNNLDHLDFNKPMTNMIRSHGIIWRTTKHVPFLGPILLAMPLSVLEKTSGRESREFVAFLRHNKARTEAEMAGAGMNDEVTGETQHATLVQSILKSTQLPKPEKDFERILNEVDAVTSAGIETVGQTLRLTCFHIYDDSKILRNLRDELSEVSGHFSHHATSTEGLLPQLERLPYLTAVVKEGLRMSPGIATRMARIAPDRGIQYGPYNIPAGTPVGMTVLTNHYDETQYPNPQNFDPERWLGSADGGQKVFAPFSRGTRMCVGMHLAYAELYMIIAALVTKFDISYVDGNAEDVRPNHDSFVIGTKEKHGPIAAASVVS